MDDTLDPTWLKIRMKNADIGVEQLAKDSGVSRSQIQRIRGGMAAKSNTLRTLRSAIAAFEASKTETIS